jgi:hypothetical protein
MKKLLLAGALAAMPLSAQERAPAPTAERSFPVLASFADRTGRCKGRPGFSGGVGNRAWIYSLDGKPLRSFMVRRDRSGHTIALDAWYIVSATMPRGAGQLVQAVWRPTGQLSAGVWWLDSTAPLDTHTANRRPLTSAEQDSARVRAAEVLAKCAQ